MKKITIITVGVLFAVVANAQVLYSNGATLTLKTGGTIKVNGNAQFQSGSTLTNNGTITITGNVTNNQTMGVANAGILTFNGTTAQTLSGSSGYFARDVIMNNAAGVTINSPLKVDGVFNFNNGIVTAASTANAVTFTTNGTVSGTNAAKDVSHINGYVVKEGTGSFTFPVGDGAKYQKCDVNASANSTGLRVKYNAADAGAGTFTTSGTDPVTLLSYNTNEYWDVTPLGTATGSVTIYWDGYKDSYTNPVAQRKVAHRSGGNWLNEGSTGTGTIAAGSIASNAVSTWSPFAMGSVSSALPLHLLFFTGSRSSDVNHLQWKTENEINAKEFVVERSRDGSSFTSIATVQANGNQGGNYSYTDATDAGGKIYYHLKMIDNDGQFSYSHIILLSSAPTSSAAVYPNPVKATASLQLNGTGLLHTKAPLTDGSGKIIRVLAINNRVETIDMESLPAGIYLLHLADGTVQKILKSK